MRLEQNGNTWLARTRVQDQRLRGRRAVFEAAQTLFALQGFAATPLVQIGHAVGLRTGSLYNHISSKQELLLRLTSEAYAVLRRETLSSITRPGTPEDGLRTLAFCLAHAYASAPWQMLVLEQDLACVEGPLPRRVRELQDELRRTTFDLVRRGQTIGVFDPVPADPVADLLLGAGRQVARRAIHESRLVPEDVAFEHADLALRLVGGSP